MPELTFIAFMTSLMHGLSITSAGTLLAQPAEPVTEVVGSEAVSEQVSFRWHHCCRISGGVRAIIMPCTQCTYGLPLPICYSIMQEAKRYCREVVRVLRTLKEKRDMSLNEVKLTVAIEDPIKREQKEYMGIEVAAFLLPQQQVICTRCKGSVSSRSELSKHSSSLTAALPEGAAGAANLRSAGRHEDSRVSTRPDSHTKAVSGDLLLYAGST